MTVQLQSSTTDDDAVEGTEGYIVCIEVREDQLDPRDRGRIHVTLLRRDILIRIVDDDQPPRECSLSSAGVVVSCHA